VQLFAETHRKLYDGREKGTKESKLTLPDDVWADAEAGEGSRLESREVDAEPDPLSVCDLLEESEPELECEGEGVSALLFCWARFKSETEGGGGWAQVGFQVAV
jgi:hypothetical protein